MAKIEIDAFYPYSIDLVWEALTERESLNQWLMENDFEPRIGHKFQFRAKPQPGWRGIVDCEILEIEKPNLLVMSWQGDPKKPKTILKWILEARGDGTNLHLEHTGFTGVGGFILSKFMMGPGWKRMLTKYIPVVLGHIKNSGLNFPREKLIKEKCAK